MSRTKSLIRRAALLAAAMLCVPMARAGTGDVALDGLVAERMSLLADQILSEPETTNESMHQALALINVARDLKPDEFRFARAAADLCMQMGDRDRALEALTAVRRIEPADQVAMIQFIDLTTSKMETAEQKVAYLSQIVDAKGVATEVQSHAAVQLMDLYYSRSQDGEAREILAKALKLNPQNIPALKANFRLATESGSARERVSALCDLMRAAPTDADGMLTLAHEADAVGNYEASGTLRMFAMQVNNLRGEAPSADEAINFVGTQMLAGQKDPVEGVIGQLLQALPEDGRAYTLALLAKQLTGEVAPAAEEIASARGVYLAQLAGVSQLLNEPDKKEMPTTNPAVPMPNLKADVAKLKAGDPQQLTVAYAVALTEQLWFDMYFKAAEVDDASIAALAELLGESDPIIVRLQGWKLLGAGKTDEARIKLEAVADRDGFARLGMIVANQLAGNVDKTREEMTEMLRQRPSGMIAAYAAVTAKQLAVVSEQTLQEMEVAELITPTQRWLGEVLSNPRGSYLLGAQPEKVSYALGEPMIVYVTLLNNGRVPITIGAGGLVDPVFVVDAEVRKTPPAVFTGVARGMFTGAIRLRPGQKITQRVRIDRGSLSGFLRQFPTPLFPMTGYVTTNAFQDKSGASRSGPAGQQTSIGKAFERQSAPLYVESYRTKVLDQFANGSTTQRMILAELFGTLVGPLKSQPGNAEAAEVGRMLDEALKTSLEKETNPELRSWLQLLTGAELSDQNRLSEFAANKTLLAQVGSMVMARLAPKETREMVARAVLKSQPSDPIVEFAKALAAQGDVQKQEQEFQDEPQ